MLSTAIDCARYAKFSPDGNPGIFQNNNGGNPRNWCPGALVEPRVFEATLFMDGNECTSVIETSQILAGRSMSETRAAMVEAERRFGAAALETFGKKGEWSV